MNALNGERDIEWVPDSGFQLRKAGVQFDAVRVDGETGRRLADLMEELVGGEPGPVVTEANGRRGVYFLVPPGSTAHRCWPREVTILNSTRNRVSYVPVPALEGRTWPLSWRYPPTGPGRFVHTLILINAAESLLYPGRDR
ncbi:hypothetical protein J7F02_14315 [Streptomyces sp. ISL-112]|uniref:hypothetical protein n=1 Tax=unclassified Streptomyces TaxID=2593676 RepID=UPI001BEA9EBD|nr:MULTISPECIES: hypothetical protein [unclassified Streptomyces]MBT2426816.1 hypothetical protein [Streptomyces sp. ISL-112]MBT2461881.1 hypothetical protein [Streptomyces sp. ISL-63]